MEYVYIPLGVFVYFFVATHEWAIAEENSKPPFIYAAFWPVWLVLYLTSLCGLAVIAAIWIFVMFFAEIFKASNKRA